PRTPQLQFVPGVPASIVVKRKDRWIGGVALSPGYYPQFYCAGIVGSRMNVPNEKGRAPSSRRRNPHLADRLRPAVRLSWDRRRSHSPSRCALDASLRNLSLAVPAPCSLENPSPSESGPAATDDESAEH